MVRKKRTKKAPARAVSRKKKARKPRNDSRRKRNREALLGAAGELATSEGAAGLTPLRITERAGLHKRAFYAHFTDAAHCMRELARQTSAADIAQDMAPFHAGFASSPPDDELLLAAVEGSLRSALAAPQTFRFLIQRRSDQDPLGEAARALLAVLRREWTDMLWALALRYPIDATHRHEIERLAEHLVDNHLTVVRRLLDDRDEDVASAAHRSNRYNRAIVIAELRRMMGLRPIAGGEELDRLTRRG